MCEFCSFNGTDNTLQPNEHLGFGLFDPSAAVERAVRQAQSQAARDAAFAAAVPPPPTSGAKADDDDGT